MNVKRFKACRSLIFFCVLSLLNGLVTTINHCLADILTQDLQPPTTENQMSDRMKQLLAAYEQQTSNTQVMIDQQLSALHQQNLAKEKQQVLERERQRQLAQTRQLRLEQEKARRIEQERKQQLEQAQRMRRQQINQRIQALNQKIAHLHQLQKEAIAEAEHVHEIVTTQPNCQKYVTTRNWYNPCDRIHSGYRMIHYADIQRKVAEDDIYVCTKSAQPREVTRCLLTHVITDRNMGYIPTERFSIPKKVRAYAVVKDFWNSAHLCITIYNLTTNQPVINNECFRENTEIPLPYSDEIDQQFSVTISHNAKNRDPRNLNKGLFSLSSIGNKGGVYIESDNVNIDRRPVEAAQRKMRNTVAELEKQIKEVENQRDKLVEELR